MRGLALLLLACIACVSAEKNEQTTLLRKFHVQYDNVPQTTFAVPPSTTVVFPQESAGSSSSFGSMGRLLFVLGILLVSLAHFAPHLRSMSEPLELNDVDEDWVVDEAVEEEEVYLEPVAVTAREVPYEPIVVAPLEVPVEAVAVSTSDWPLVDIEALIAEEAVAVETPDATEVQSLPSLWAGIFSTSRADELAEACLLADRSVLAEGHAQEFTYIGEETDYTGPKNSPSRLSPKAKAFQNLSPTAAPFERKRDNRQDVPLVSQAAPLLAIALMASAVTAKAKKRPAAPSFPVNKHRPRKLFMPTPVTPLAEQCRERRNFLFSPSGSMHPMLRSPTQQYY
jgi:hypothetical protein